MARYARQPEPKSTIADYAANLIDQIGASAANNPLATGGTVAFTVVMFFVSSNALFYQPFEHRDAFFQTRSMSNYKPPELPKSSVNRQVGAENTENFVISRSSDIQSTAKPDMQLVDIQAALASMKLYTGTIDGLPGPKTREAIASFQHQAGLEPTGEVDVLLVDAIKTASIPTSDIPVPAKKKVTPQINGAIAAMEASDGLSEVDVKKLQAGLKAFGNDGIEIDGKVGGKTKQAILEFQSLFKLPQTGLADRETLNKLHEIGLVAG